MVHYEVVAVAELGGALVREGKSLTSQQLARLGVGAVINELERAGERLRFKKVSGSGPESGWVSAKLLEKCEATKAAPTKYQGKSLLALAEAKVLEKGAPQALKESGKDGAGLLVASMALLAQGDLTGANEKAKAAQEALKGNKEQEASALLALALTTSEAKTALGHGMAAQAAFKEVGDKQMEASALTALANLRLSLKELSVAEALVKDALRIFHECKEVMQIVSSTSMTLWTPYDELTRIKDPEGEEAAEATLLEICTLKDTSTSTASVYQERAAYCKSKSDKLGQGQALQKMAEQLLESASKEALESSKEALELLQQAGDQKGTLSALHTAALATGDKSKVEEALKISRSLGDESSQVELLTTLSALHLRGHQKELAKTRAAEAQTLAKKLQDEPAAGRAAHAVASAMLASGETTEALALAKDAAKLLTGAARALALCTAAGAAASKEACELLRQAVPLFSAAKDAGGEATAKLQLATALLAYEGPLVEVFQSRSEAAGLAEQARCAFLVLGDQRSQGRASNVAAQSKILLNDLDGGIEAAMQGVVLARSCGDKELEAYALRTALAGMVSKGCSAKALRLAKEVKILFHKLGVKAIEESLDSLILQLEEELPKISPIQRMTITPKDTKINLSSNSLFTQATNCIVWSLPLTQMTYMMYLFELLKFVDDLKNIPDRVAFLVMTKGVMARHTGEMAASQFTGALGTTVWAVCRTIRLESPKLLVCTVDMPSSATTHEMTDCIRAAQLEPGPRNEIAFIVDRKNQLGKRPY
ncbi:unnamed protein product [Durusdinium trenchii]|uniref:SH3 domain-containing protein n=1 Tax=Durusdinium trenchii TaxID=1381693 RepID=A0ABP0N6Z3_9DINO